MSKPNVSPAALHIAGRLVSGNLLEEFARPVIIDTPSTRDDVAEVWAYECGAGLTDLPLEKFYSMWLEQERISRDAKNYAVFTQRQRQVAEALSVEFPVRIKNNKQAFDALVAGGLYPSAAVLLLGKTVTAQADYTFGKGVLQIKGWAVIFPESELAGNYIPSKFDISIFTQLKPVHRMSKVFDIIKNMK